MGQNHRGYYLHFFDVNVFTKRPNIEEICTCSIFSNVKPLLSSQLALAKKTYQFDI